MKELQNTAGDNSLVLYNVDASGRASGHAAFRYSIHYMIIMQRIDLTLEHGTPYIPAKFAPLGTGCRQVGIVFRPDNLLNRVAWFLNFRKATGRDEYEQAQGRCPGRNHDVR
mgnify:CR=1 FL=1